ncbi:polysaccharide deacetylase family protein, partial [Kineosporia sp. A_224]|uniref:polysaccharide deacetylase family protein n=1 Tax=Kineosporia sp. A_224 TaxID=1962180 RepID=UPI000B4A6F54
HAPPLSPAGPPAAEQVVAGASADGPAVGKAADEGLDETADQATGPAVEEGTGPAAEDPADPVAEETADTSPRSAAGAGADCPRPRSGVLSTGGGEGRTVALTFDDGPDAQTGAVLDVLAREEVPATFFVVGEHVVERPGLVRRAVSEGHLVGNHTWDHSYPRDVRGGWTRPYLDRSLGRTSEAVTEASDAPVCWFRPPGGFLPATVLPAARGLHMTTTLWSVDSLDWKVQSRRATTAAEHRRQVDAVVAAATAAAGQRHPVVLLHDGGGERQVTVDALPRIIDWYRTHGYAFVRVDGSR